ncbi:hypothetical protein [Caldibacillus thermoamylovorans]|uniref:hypothetical protein n=1 Tax=Caldibacillus thermoamylovorans TaxID=35841 RepID=UPI00126A427B|nr:hypothetical protein [Caldibacillus thermoamylovorans]
MATKPFLVVIFWPETSFFGDETFSRRRFEAENLLFWRQGPFSSLFLGKKIDFLRQHTLPSLGCETQVH